MSFKNVVEPEELVPTYRCPCCKYKTLRGRGQDEICPDCIGTMTVNTNRMLR